MPAITRFAIATFLTLSAFQALRAQGHFDTADSGFQRDIAVLKEDLKNLASQQRQILDQLNELKQLLEANPAARTARPLPSTVAVKGELFRGDSAARVAIVEYGDFECPYCGRYMRDWGT
jgi:protein-disulfide isomerase